MGIDKSANARRGTRTTMRRLHRPSSPIPSVRHTWRPVRPFRLIDEVDLAEQFRSFKAGVGTGDFRSWSTARVNDTSKPRPLFPWVRKKTGGISYVDPTNSIPNRQREEYSRDKRSRLDGIAMTNF